MVTILVVQPKNGYAVENGKSEARNKKIFGKKTVDHLMFFRHVIKSQHPA